jgi:predicted nucleotidyltransferase
MTRDQVLQRLAGARAELAGLGVRSLDLFGSVARGESGPDSDVDLLVELDKPIGLFHFFRVQRRIEEILGSKVDLVMRDAAKRQLRDRIFAEAVRATWGVAPSHRGHPRSGRTEGLIQVRYLRSYASCVYCLE